MEEVQKGDMLAMQTLVERYERRLFGYACRILGDRERAADIFQETFLRVFQKRHTYKRGHGFSPWVHRICLNLCRDAFRRSSRRSETNLDDRWDVADDNPGPDEEVHRRRLAQRVRRAVEGLPEKHREVFLLAHYQNLSYPEVSQVLGIPVGTVKSRMHHATRKLAEELKDLESDIE